MSQDQSPPQPAEQLLEITDIHTFVHHLTAWHASKIALLRHMVDIPEGSDLSLEGEEPINLSGPALLAFQTGLKLAIGELESLPFSAEMEDEEPSGPAAAVTGTALVN